MPSEEPATTRFDRCAGEIDAIDEALARGELDESGWHAAMAGLVVPAYLAADTPWEQSGKSGDEATWERARRPVAAAIDRSGTFLDVGCANGFLMESVRAWSVEKGHQIEPYGLEISPELAELARRRLPHWADRIFVGNARDWSPPRRFDFVRTGLEYAPPGRRRELVERLMREVVTRGGRLIVGVFNEETDVRATEEAVASWGFPIAGRLDAPHRNPAIVYRVFWLDAEE
jgi:SAM-dependent methyltransferase